MALSGLNKICNAGRLGNLFLCTGGGLLNACNSRKQITSKTMHVKTRFKSALALSRRKAFRMMERRFGFWIVKVIPSFKEI